MNYELLGKPDFPIVKINLAAGESVIAESGAMVAHSAGVAIKTEARGGILQAAKRSLLGGESFFVNTFTAEGGAGEPLSAARRVSRSTASGVDSRRCSAGRGFSS